MWMGFVTFIDFIALNILHCRILQHKSIKLAYVEGIKRLFWCSVNYMIEVDSFGMI